MKQISKIIILLAVLLCLFGCNKKMIELNRSIFNESTSQFENNSTGFSFDVPEGFTKVTTNQTHSDEFIKMDIIRDFMIYDEENSIGISYINLPIVYDGSVKNVNDYATEVIDIYSNMKNIKEVKRLDDISINNKTFGLIKILGEDNGLEAIEYQFYYQLDDRYIMIIDTVTNNNTDINYFINLINFK